MATSLILSALGCAAISLAAAVDRSCSSFGINGSQPAEFNFYRFYDFQYSDAANTNITASNWPLNRTLDKTLAQEKNFSDKAWVEEWSVRNAYKEPANDNLTALHYITENVFMGEKDGKGFLVLNTSRLANNTQLGGEIFFRPADVDAVSLRVSARVYGDTGGVAGFFTYFNDTQESDIEVLLRDDGTRVHFTNQPTLGDEENEIPGTTFNRSLPENRTVDEWVVYRLDWLPQLNMSTWYVDGELMETSQIHVPVVSSTVLINMWSNCGFWSGEMPVWGDAVLEIQWIEMLFNASSLAVEGAPEEGVSCQIDTVPEDENSDDSDAVSRATRLDVGLRGWFLAVLTAGIVACWF
ncbi:hypothetical protein NM208_g2328 [Fusarium decemcellulare]|uniref:Uncharacterized protein n=1 Tax=Fusarium decemcellulare TaxID=57161 RepID=A0ACC1SSX3_9HYPO|nr:hypothetical protein NM208_g2328 [Fusarium decemcellulare]